MLHLERLPSLWKNAVKRPSGCSAMIVTQKSVRNGVVQRRGLSMAPVRQVYRKLLRKVGVAPAPPKIPTKEEFELMKNEEKYAWSLLSTRWPSPWDQTETLSRSLLRQLIESNYLPAKYTYATMVATGSMRGEMSEAIKLWEECSRTGHSWAKANLAKMLVEGKGVRQDLDRAAMLYQEAWECAPVLSESHAHTSALNLADLYLKAGREKESAKWLLKAGEEAHDVLALYQLGHAYSYGKMGFEVDLEKARDYTQRAADAGLVLAQHNLGCLLYEGTPTHPADYVAAAHYFSLAHYQEYYWSSLNLANLFARGQGVPQNFATAHVLLQDVLAFGSTEQQNAASLVLKNVEMLSKGQSTPDIPLQMRQRDQVENPL